MGKYTLGDAARNTSIFKDAAQAWHDARDAAAAEGGWGVPANRHGEW